MTEHEPDKTIAHDDQANKLEKNSSAASLSQQIVAPGALIGRFIGYLSETIHAWSGASS